MAGCDSLDDGFTGGRQSFTGVASTGRGPHTTLTRYAIANPYAGQFPKIRLETT